MELRANLRAHFPLRHLGHERQLLGALFESAEEMLRLGHKQSGRRERVAAVQQDLARRLGWESSRLTRLTWRLPDSAGGSLPLTAQPPA